MADFTHVSIRNELLIRNLEDMRKRMRIMPMRSKRPFVVIIRQRYNRFWHQKGVFSNAKFDSLPELLLARVLETDNDALNWLRPAPREFNITYNRGHNYEPDFVVETESAIYLVEVKGEDKLNDPDVIAKKNRGIQYCEVASRWGRANGYKEWKYLFIPSKQALPNSSFTQLAMRFQEK